MPKAKAKEDNVTDINEATASTEKAPSAEDIAIRKAFDDNSTAEEEVTKLAMINAGCKIKAVSRMYNTFMIDSGQMASKEEKDDALTSELEDTDLSEEGDFNTAVENLVDTITGSTVKSVSAMVRAWAKKNDVECYKKPAGTPGQSGFTHKFHEALLADPTMDKATCTKFIEDNGSDNTKRHESSYQTLRQFANDMNAKLAA